MGKQILWLIVSGLMVFSLVLAACGSAATPSAPTTPSVPAVPAAPITPVAPTTPGQEKPQQEAVKPVAETPKYGGTLVLTQASSMTDWNQSVGLTVNWYFLFDSIHGGNWAKGAAGGYGSGETDFASSYDRFDQYVGFSVEDYKWSIDKAADEVTIVYQVRQGVRYHQIPGNTYSVKASGREMTADDIVWTLNWQTHTQGNYINVTVPELATADIKKTGPWEVTVKFKGATILMPALTNLNGKYSIVRPPEIAESNRFDKWQQQIGTGPFMLKEYIPDSQGVLIKNPNYWATDPVGPGKGNKLPYIDGLKYLIIPDFSTRQAALRTGKIDQLFDFSIVDTDSMRKTAPQLKESEYYGFTPNNPVVHMRVDIPPFTDIRVRHAMMYATDFEAIRKGLNQGKGIINTYPFMYNKAYADLWTAEDDPAMSEKVRDLYVYNPEKAKQLLKEAGYPSGFKVDVLAQSAQVDYLAVLKDMWSKVGVNLEFMVRDTATYTNLLNKHEQPPLATQISNAVGRFYQPWSLTGKPSYFNVSGVNDPTINAKLDEVRALAATDLVGAMRLMKDFVNEYVLYQAFAVPGPGAPVYSFWWPWVKNYSGELQMLLGTYSRWAQWVWLDQDLKKSMGY